MSLNPLFVPSPVRPIIVPQTVYVPITTFDAESDTAMEISAAFGLLFTIAFVVMAGVGLSIAIRHWGQ